MATVNAPYPSRMDEIDAASIVSRVREGDSITLLNRAEEEVLAFDVQPEASGFAKARVTLDAFDVDAREVIVKDWYRPTFPNQKLTNPATLPTGNGYGAAWSPDGTYLAVAHDTSPYITIYKRAGDGFTKLTDPATLPTGNGRAVSWAPDGQYLAVAHDTSPYITIYKRAGDVFTKLPDAATLPTGTGQGIDWSPDGLYLTIAHTTSPLITTYKRTAVNSDTFVKLTNPTTLPPGTIGTDVAWSQGGQYMAVASNTDPGITIYKRAGDVFTKLADPDVVPGNLCRGVSWSPDDQYLAFAHNSGPDPALTFATIYKRVGDVFTRLDGLGGPLEINYAVDWSPDGRYVGFAYNVSPYVLFFKLDEDEFTQLANPATLPTGIGRGIGWSPDGKHVAITHTTSPYVTIYKSAMGPISGPAIPIELVP